MSKYYKADDVERMLEELAREPNYKHADEEWFEGVMLAQDRIESLPTIEVNEDAISRGNLISDLAGIWEDGYTPNLPRTMLDFQDMLEDINYKIRNAPSVIPKPKEGEWSLTLNYAYRCTACGLITSSYKANYCPNCGAKMKGADDESEN